MMSWLDSKLRHKAWYRQWRGLPKPMSPELAAFNWYAMEALEQYLTFEATLGTKYQEAFRNQEPGKTISIRRPQRFMPPNK